MKKTYYTYTAGTTTYWFADSKEAKLNHSEHKRLNKKVSEVKIHRYTKESSIETAERLVNETVKVLWEM